MNLNFTSLPNYDEILRYSQWANLTDRSLFTPEEEGDFERDSLYILLPITVIYGLIFISGTIGNAVVCVVIGTNKLMHTATNYYLCNLAVSDFLLLVVGAPLDIYSLWNPGRYPFDRMTCICHGLISETAANATVLTITSFTIERYIAICYPFRSQTMSKLSRAFKFVLAIWIVAFTMAVPQVLQFGIIEEENYRICSIKDTFYEHAFILSSCLFFLVPMTIIGCLYILIGVRLKRSKLVRCLKRQNSEYGCNFNSQSKVIKMLVAVVLAFFFCWAPFHVQRILAVYGKIYDREYDPVYYSVYNAFNYISGVLYFLSTCVNPIVYNIMSHKFRDASKKTITGSCCMKKQQIGSQWNRSSMRTQRFHPMHEVGRRKTSQSGTLASTGINNVPDLVAPNVITFKVNDERRNRAKMSITLSETLPADNEEEI